VFAPDFNGTLDGLAAGVMATDGDVFFTCIPNLWRLRDTNGDGIADERQVLQSGFGVNAGFLGHDLHGLCWGPDGKLYFSVGDRGFHLRTKDGLTLHGPRNGAIFRCLPDGSEMEVVMRGLRNPQEIAFDQFGNLFAADNNCDKGDHSRLVFVIEGGHAGWNMAFQSLPDPYLTGPWHAEKMWHLPATSENVESNSSATANSAASAAAQQAEDRPAWLLPPVGKLGAGPSGFAYYPGTGLPNRYDHHFFLCNYTGSGGGIEAFTVVPHGAGFQIVDEHDFLKPISATDCEFGYDGRLYVSDFVNLIWDGGTSGGRIFRVSDTDSQAKPIVKETADLVRNGIRSLDPKRLGELLGHQDLRVRQRAQFALAELGSSSESAFISAIAINQPRLMRCHGIWGLGQLVAAERRLRFDDPQTSPPSATPGFTCTIDWQISSAEQIVQLLNDQDAEVRAQALRTLGDLRYQPAAEKMTAALSDSDARVRMFAALAVGRVHHAPAVPAVAEMLRLNADRDPWLRHAGVMALSGMEDQKSVTDYSADPHSSVRMAVLLTVRMWLLQSQQHWSSNDSDEIPAYEPNEELIAVLLPFLQDKDWSIVAEAGRAVNDLPLESATSSLAAMADGFSAEDKIHVPDSLLRRIINANFRIGQTQHLRRVLQIATDSMLSMPVRREALDALTDWNQPGSRDRVTGFWRPVASRDDQTQQSVRQVLTDNVGVMLATTSDELQSRLVGLINVHQLPTDDGVFASWVADSTKTVSLRVAALRLLTSRKSELTGSSLESAIVSEQPLLRAEARDVLMTVQPDRAVGLQIETVLNGMAHATERQRAIMALAALKHPSADETLKNMTMQLVQGTLESVLQLDVIEAVALRGLPELKQQVDQFKAEQSKAGLLAQHLISTHGGDAERGRSVFAGHRVAQCVRCHKVGEQMSGGNAGPDLAQVAHRHDRAGLLQSLVEPSAKIAKGFETVTLVLESGKIVAGIVRSEENGSIVIEQTDGQLITVLASDVEERTAPKSSMPEMHRALTAREIRDLVEFLSSLK
jgi:quinoprotein glucose dehydrogenase